jgi:broad specificity phosphatase PhoE
MPQGTRTMNLLEAIVEVLSKVQFEEAIDLRRQIQTAAAINPHLEPMLLMKLQVLKHAQKNAAEAVKAMEHLELTEEALAWYAVINKELQEVSREANKA